MVRFITKSKKSRFFLRNQIRFCILGVIDELNVAYLELPYSVENSAISMFVYLPIENTTKAVDDLLSKFSVKTIHEALTAGSIQEVDVEFPKISLDGSYLLAQVS